MEEYVLLLSLSIVGIIIAGFIYYKKSRKEKLVCIAGTDCNKVVNSRYSTTFGFDNTVLGMLYYVFIIAAALGQVVFDGMFTTPLVYWAKVLVTASAAAFSVFLTYIQIVVLKEWCEYCLVSALISILIFLVVLL